MVRLLFLIHRYLGIAVGLIMLIWTVSGIIMMYQEYPELDALERRELLPAVNLENCCRSPVSPVFNERGFKSARVEMQAGLPVLRVAPIEGPELQYDLTTGRPLPENSREQADAIAEEFTKRRFPQQAVVFDSAIHNDQWTVYSSYNRHRPLFRYRVDDAEKSEFYISSRSGEIVQLTNSQERLWGYLGAVIHWFYPTVLRQHTQIWAQTVIWLSVLGIFLTAIGLYIGIRQFGRRRNGRNSPYRGIELWHHYTGLVFGLLTLTWVFSGLFSMNPWGLLEGEGIASESSQLSGRPLEWPEISSWVAALQNAPVLPEAVQYELTVLAGNAQLIAYDNKGFGERLDAQEFTSDPLTDRAIRELASGLQPDEEITNLELLSEGDAYYYEHRQTLEFPVWRVQFADNEARRYYLSPIDGRIVRKVDRDGRWYRWLFNGLHRGDFTSLLRSRPLWDVFMVCFLLGVTAVCATGCVMAWRRVKRDLRLIRHRMVGAASSPSGKRATHLRGRGSLLMALSLVLIGCESEEPGEWIEVPLSDATFFVPQSDYHENEYEVLVLRNSALEYKLGMREGDAIAYHWSVEMAEPELLTAEFHGHTHRVAEEPGTVMFYKIHNEGEERGALVAPFDGIHGWYLDNQSAEDITVRLRVSGFYSELEQ